MLEGLHSISVYPRWHYGRWNFFFVVSSFLSQLSLYNEFYRIDRIKNKIRSVIHPMETIVGYSPDKSQNMVLMGGLTKHVPITKTSFLLGTLSLSGIPLCVFFILRNLNDS
ncbi:hypothetical protein Leryth_025779 [Lithospermum erythrorhizon]|nr:hypothetical protein Leryth_025779 [Lithospermum erythrorhizon]